VGNDLNDHDRPRRRSRRRAIGNLMGYTALGGLAAGLIACAVRWEVISTADFVRGFHPLAVPVLIAAAGAAIGIGIAGSIAYPLYRTYGHESGTARMLSFTAGMLAVPVVAMAVMFWIRLAW
jgi:hypothetical protein